MFTINVIMGLFVCLFPDTSMSKNQRGYIPTLEKNPTTFGCGEVKKNIVVRVNLSCTAMKPLDYLGFLVDLSPHGFSPIQFRAGSGHAGYW